MTARSNPADRYTFELLSHSSEADQLGKKTTKEFKSERPKVWPNQSIVALKLFAFLFTTLNVEHFFCSIFVDGLWMRFSSLDIEYLLI